MVTKTLLKFISYFRREVDGEVKVKIAKEGHITIRKMRGQTRLYGEVR